MATINVLYPSDATFNMDYYLKTHMPFVDKKWRSGGLKSWKVVKAPQGQYGVQAILEFESLQAFGAAAQSEAGKEVMADIPNFCDKQPTIVTSDDVASS